jgi:hypothetical protein
MYKPFDYNKKMKEMNTNGPRTLVLLVDPRFYNKYSLEYDNDISKFYSKYQIKDTSNICCIDDIHHPILNNIIKTYEKDIIIYHQYEYVPPQINKQLPKIFYNSLREAFIKRKTTFKMTFEGSQDLILYDEIGLYNLYTFYKDKKERFKDNLKMMIKCLLNWFITIEHNGKEKQIFINNLVTGSLNDIIQQIKLKNNENLSVLGEIDRTTLIRNIDGFENHFDKYLNSHSSFRRYVRPIPNLKLKIITQNNNII